jgi:GNAT superfamily N-acetyltransferase
MADRYRRAILDPDGDDLLLVAEEGGIVVGTAFGHVVVPSAVSDEPAVELGGIIVRPSHRERGIGLALAEQVARFARKRGIRIVTLKTFAANEPALRFWERIGFAPRMVQMYAPAERLDGMDGPEG